MVLLGLWVWWLSVVSVSVWCNGQWGKRQGMSSRRRRRQDEGAWPSKNKTRASSGHSTTAGTFYGDTVWWGGCGVREKGVGVCFSDSKRWAVDFERGGFPLAHPDRRAMFLESQHHHALVELRLSSSTRRSKKQDCPTLHTHPKSPTPTPTQVARQPV